MRQKSGDIVLYEGNNELNIAMIPLLPSIEIANFYYIVLHAGYLQSPSKLTTRMIDKPGQRTYYIGFKVRNNESIDVSGITVDFRIDGADLGAPYCQGIPDVIVDTTPPFTVSPGETGNDKYFFWDFRPIWYGSLDHYTAYGELKVNGELVDSVSIEFDVLYG